MLKIFATSILGVAALATAAAACDRGGPIQKSPVQAPAPMTARADGGYRMYSYEPAAPVYRYQSYGRPRGPRPSYLDARSKAMGWGY